MKYSRQQQFQSETSLVSCNPERHPKSKWRRITSWHAQSDVAPCDTRSLRLSRLVPLWPHEIEEPTREAGLRVIEALENALRAERRRGKSGHWCYDLNRHMELSRALKEERQRYRRKFGTQPAQCQPKATGPAPNRQIGQSPLKSRT